MALLAYNEVSIIIICTRLTTNHGPNQIELLARDLDNPDQRSTLLVMSFGQFVDHDVTHTPILKNGAGNDIDCCRCFNEDCKGDD